VRQPVSGCVGGARSGTNVGPARITGRTRRSRLTHPEYCERPQPRDRDGRRSGLAKMDAGTVKIIFLSEDYEQTGERRPDLAKRGRYRATGPPFQSWGKDQPCLGLDLHWTCVSPSLIWRTAARWSGSSEQCGQLVPGTAVVNGTGRSLVLIDGYRRVAAAAVGVAGRGAGRRAGKDSR
jgi:hypothetical protein